MRFISWNVNGLRAILTKGFDQLFADFDADCVCLQETKMQEGQAHLAYDGYTAYYNCADRKGYSGTATVTRCPGVTCTRGIGVDRHDHEGRVLTLDLGPCYLVNVYTPNSQTELARLEYRMDWERDFADYVRGLDAVKPVVICGDLNVAHKEIDLTNPARNRRNPGFTDEERQALTDLLESGFCDTFRLLHPDATGAYSWWGYRFNSRAKNIGWRIDYFLVSKRLSDKVLRAEILDQITGSDHCPVLLELNF